MANSIITDNPSGGDVPTETSSLIQRDLEGSSKNRRRLQTPRRLTTWRKIAIMVGCMSMQAISSGVGFGLGIMYPELIRAFNASSAEVALVQSIYFGIATGSGIIWSGIMKRYGCGYLVIIGGLLATIGSIISSQAPNVTTIVIGTGVITGTGMSIGYLAPFIIISLLIKENTSVYLVFLSTGSSIGQLAIPFIYETCLTKYGWSGTFLIISGVLLQCVPLGTFAQCALNSDSVPTDKTTYETTALNPDSIPPVKQSSEKYALSTDSFDTDEEFSEAKTINANVCTPDKNSSEVKEVSDSDGKDVSKRRQNEYLNILKDPVVITLLINYLMMSVTGNIEAWFITDILILRGFPRQAGSDIVSMIGLANFVARIVAGVVKMKVKWPTAYHWAYITPMMGLGHGLVLYFTDYGAIFASCVIYTLFSGTTVAHGPALMLEAVDLQRFPYAMAMVNVTYGVGNFLGGVLGGTIKEIYGNYDVVFYLAVAGSLYITVTTLILIPIMRHRQRRRGYEQLESDMEIKLS